MHNSWKDLPVYLSLQDSEIRSSEGDKGRGAKDVNS